MIIPDGGNHDKLFKGQHSHEELQCFYRKHWIVLIAPIVMSTVFLLAFGLFLIFMRQSTFLRPSGIVFQSVLVLSFVFATYYIHRFFVGIYNYFLDIVIISNYRIVDFNKTLILHDTQEVVDIAKIQDVTKKQDGLIRNILNYGRLVITLSSSSSNKVLHYVPNPDFHFRIINRTKREYIRQKNFDRKSPDGISGELRRPLGYDEAVLEVQSRD